MNTTTLAPVQLRRILAHVPTSITVIAGVEDNHQPLGMVLGSFIGLSLDPPLLGVSIQHSSTSWPRLRALQTLGISVLTRDHLTVIPTLSGPVNGRFNNVDWSAQGTAVHLPHAAAEFTVRLKEEIPTGDHMFAIFEVLDAEEKPAGSPLVFHSSTVTSL